MKSGKQQLQHGGSTAKKLILQKIKSWPHFISYTGNKDQLPDNCAQGVHLAMDITECYTLYPEQSG